MLGLTCYSCNGKFEAEAPLSRREECPHCKTDMRVCKMCIFYDPQTYNECREPNAERILEKDKANFCGYFNANPELRPKQSKDDLLAAANALFKN